MSKFVSIVTTSANSVETDLGCTSRIYFDNVTLTVLKANGGDPDLTPRSWSFLTFNHGSNFLHDYQGK